MNDELNKLRKTLVERADEIARCAKTGKPIKATLRFLICVNGNVWQLEDPFRYSIIHGKPFVLN